MMQHHSPPLSIDLDTAALEAVSPHHGSSVAAVSCGVRRARTVRQILVLGLHEEALIVQAQRRGSTPMQRRRNCSAEEHKNQYRSGYFCSGCVMSSAGMLFVLGQANFFSFTFRR